VQYRTRSIRASVSTGVTGIAVAILIFLMWPSQERPLPVPEWANRESALRLVAESQKGEFNPYENGFWSSSGGWQLGGVRLGLSGVEAGWLATVKLVDSTVRFDDGTTLATAGNGFSSGSFVPFESVDDSPIRVVMRQVLGVARVQEVPYSRFTVEAMPAIVVRQADFRTYSRTPGAYRGRFLVDLDHVEIAATLPLEAGAEFQGRRRRIVIDQVVRQPQAASIRLREFTAATMFDADALPPVSFYLRNRDKAEAVTGLTRQGIGMSTDFGFSFLGLYSAGPGTGFAVTGDVIRFSEAQTDEQFFEISADWLSHAELVIVDTIPGGSVTRTLEISGFEIAAAPPRASR